MATYDNEAPMADPDINNKTDSSRSELPEAKMDFDTRAAGPQRNKVDGPSVVDDEDEMGVMQDYRQDYESGGKD